MSPERWALVPVGRDDANRYVQQHHRHLGRVAGAKFYLGVGFPPEGDLDEWRIVGVAIVGRPVARHLDDGWTLEVNRLCTEGYANACSFLYAAAWRAAKALGYRRLVTYSLASESGASLRAAGWRVVAERSARPGWNTPSRPRVDSDHEPRLLWEAS